MVFVNWAKLIAWILAISGVVYLFKDIRSKFAWMVIFILVGGYGFIKFMQFVNEQEGGM